MKTSKIKLVSIITLLLLSIVLLSSCSDKTISKDFDEEEVKTKAEQVIALINDKNSAEIRAMGTQQIKDALTDDVLNQIYNAVEEGGTFKKIEEISSAGQVDKETNEEFAVVVAKANYENKTFMYTITFNKELELAGLFYR